ncbi:MAG: hypothetical protein GXO69_05700 [Acidobacteria bacterium]|nr:hypothetical protein [Acidobacteriota bacterium]
MKQAVLFFVVLLLLSLATGCARVDTNEVGVKTTYFSFTGETGVDRQVYGTGYHVYIPPFSGFSVLNKTEHKLEMTRKSGEGSIPRADDLKLKTSDGNNLWVDITVSWRVDPENAWRTVKNVGERIPVIEETAVRPIARGILRFAFGKLSSEEFYDAEKREKEVKEGKKLLNQALAPFGIEVTDVLVNDYRFAPDYQKAIEDRKLYDQKAREYTSLAAAAKEDVKRRVFDASAGANRVIEDAKGEMNRAKLKGDAILYAAEKQAEAVFAQKKALAVSLAELNRALTGTGGRNVVAKRLADALKGKKISIVPMSDNGTLSMIDINRFLENLAASKALEKMDVPKAERKPAGAKPVKTPVKEGTK